MANTKTDLAKSLLAAGNLNYLEELYGDYLANGTDLDAGWQEFFAGLPNGKAADGATNDKTGQAAQANLNGGEVAYSSFLNDLHQLGIASNGAGNGAGPAPAAPTATTSLIGAEDKQKSYNSLVYAYRIYGHKKAKNNPLSCKQRIDDEELQLESYGLSAADLNTKFNSTQLGCGKKTMTLQETIDFLEHAYCSSLGSEFMYINKRDRKQWLIEHLESPQGYDNLSDEKQLRILERLVAASGLESSLASKYPGTKRFGLEGGETLIPMVNELTHMAGAKQVKELVIAMAHRGRLNMLVNILGKSPGSLFDEFDGKVDISSDKVFGDVKYHQGFSCNLETEGGEVHLALSFNPSHLEIVSPVAGGSVRARQDRRDDSLGEQVLPIIIHGDASFAGQGVVTETLQMANLRAFRTGGTVHIIVNNQIGFTVSDVGDARSTEYASDVAKILEVPIFHVNGDDPDAVIFATQLALEYRMKYHSDVVLDIICYRRHGHNEADEPAITQPMMYAEIRQHPPVNDIYANKLIHKGLIKEADYTKMKEEYRDHLDNDEHVSLSLVTKPNKKLYVDWEPYLGHEWEDRFDTSIALKELEKIGKQLVAIPPGFKPHRQVEKVMADRALMLAGEKPVDWGFAELLAYGSMISSGYGVRMTGQDSRRGTFSHRQAVIHNRESGEGYCALQNLEHKMAGYKGEMRDFDIYDSFLSEEAVMAFEYGYAATTPSTLVIWEAQFGDFANGAQVVIDQFLSSGETKWQRLCGLTLLLPHGYEGQGPEHSSGRLERFLQLCADQNMQVCVPSTAGQTFHMLRRQIIRPLRKPLVVMMPKSLLRRDIAATPIKDLAKAEFYPVLGETDTKIKPAKVKRVILCSGKVYYELAKHRAENKITDAAIVRIEQLYPFPHTDLQKILKPYKNIDQLVWCQEEPMNQGAWYSTKHHLEIVQRHCCPQAGLLFAGRPSAASPAAGYMALHNKLQTELVAKAFTITV